LASTLLLRPLHSPCLLSAKGQAVASPAELAEKAVAGGGSRQAAQRNLRRRRRQRFRASNDGELAGGELAVTAGELQPPIPPSPIPPRVLHAAGRLLLTPSPSSSSASGRRKRFTVVDSKQDREELSKRKTGPLCDTDAKKAKKKTMKEVYDGEPEMLDTLIFQEHVENHWQLVVICNKGDNDMSFLMLLDSLHMGEPTRIKNKLKNFLKIAYEGKEMRAVADELKVIDLHVPKVPQQKGSTECGFMLTADWFSREEYEKFREDLQGKRIHIDARSASTSKVVKRGPTMLRSVHGLQSNERIPVKINQMWQPLGEGGGSY
ncbi:hypothetical protein Taro_028367, partial [Colocasia esculenta]|nr:hypothetical protein [Colocasia esculenta]